MFDCVVVVVCVLRQARFVSPTSTRGIVASQNHIQPLIWRESQLDFAQTGCPAVIIRCFLQSERISTAVSTHKHNICRRLECLNAQNSRECFASRADDTHPRAVGVVACALLAGDKVRLQSKGRAGSNESLWRALAAFAAQSLVYTF